MLPKKQSSSFEKKDFIILFLILSVAFIFRLYKVTTPLADLHSWRQADTAAVSRNYVRTGIDLFKPQYDDLSSIESGKENPQGLRFVEFPLYNAVIAATYSIFQTSYPIEVYGRLVTIFFSLLIISILYYLCLKESSRITAVAASTIYAVFPFFVFFSRVVLPETMSLVSMFLSILLLYIWANTKNRGISILTFLLSLGLYALTALLKPTAIFYGVVLIVIFFRKYKISLVTKLHFYLFFLLSAIPFLVWRYYISFHPEAIPASAWLITNVNTFEGSKNIFFRPAFFRWIFFERINNMIFGGYLIFFFVLGVITKAKKFLLHSILFSALIYLFTFQGGNVQHEYYQTILLPALAIMSGLGINSLFEQRKSIEPVFAVVATVIVLVLSFSFSYYRVKDFYNIPDDLVQIAKIIQTLTLSSDKIITDRMGDTTLLYLADRKGSPAPYKDLSEFKKDGYSYYVTANRQAVEDFKLKKQYEVIFDNDQFALIKL